ncbi:MAG: hypothetical protein C0605_01350 [Hyphomicrobiales bacterium]|nr:MAG: hypothetical protein C0605_01350 [Hyphomicrobiales bacterium]
MNSPKLDITEREQSEVFCTRLAGTIRNLKAVLEKETAFVRKHNIDGIADIQPNKSALSEVFQRDIMHLRSQAEAVSRLTPVPLAGLKRDIEDLGKALDDNNRLIEAKLAVSESVVKRIAETASEMKAGPSCYGSGAQMPAPASHSSAAIAIDKVL